MGAVHGDRYRATIHRCACGDEKYDIRRDDRPRAALGVLLCLSLALPAAAAAQPPAPFTRSAELAAALADASSQVQPCNGWTLPVLIGDSNMERYSTNLVTLFRQTTYASMAAPGLKFMQAASSGKTAVKWANPSDVVWQGMASRIAAATNSTVGTNDCAVPWVFGLIAATHAEGPITVAQLDAIVANVQTFLPSAKGLTLISMNPTYCSSPCLVSTTEGDAQAAVLSSFAGVHSGLPVDYVPLHDILGWSISMMDPDWVHENYALGGPYGATWMADGWRNDPLRIHHYLFRDQLPPNVDPPPPPDPPVSVPLSGTLTKDGASCTFTASQGTVSLPASWCGSL